MSIPVFVAIGLLSGFTTVRNEPAPRNIWREPPSLIHPACNEASKWPKPELRLVRCS